jgi:hypothetical protein
MNDRFGSLWCWSGHELPPFGETCTETQLRHFRKVHGSLLREALDKWAELWGEFQKQVSCGTMVLPEAEHGFKPQCGWPEFLERMWQLKLYLDCAKRLCEKGP